MFDLDAVGQAAYLAYVNAVAADYPDYPWWKDLSPQDRDIWIKVAIAVIGRTDQLSNGIQIGDRNVQNNTYGTHLRR